MGAQEEAGQPLKANTKTAGHRQVDKWKEHLQHLWRGRVPATSVGSDGITRMETPGSRSKGMVPPTPAIEFRLIPGSTGKAGKGTGPTVASLGTKLMVRSGGSPGMPEASL